MGWLVIADTRIPLSSFHLSGLVSLFPCCQGNDFGRVSVVEEPGINGEGALRGTFCQDCRVVRPQEVGESPMLRKADPVPGDETGLLHHEEEGGGVNRFVDAVELRRFVWWDGVAAPIAGRIRLRAAEALQQCN